MNFLPILSNTILLPILGACYIFFFLKDEKKIKMIAITASILTFLAALIVFFSFDPKNSNFQFYENYPLIDLLNFNYLVAVDGISIYFILLTSLLSLICFIATFANIKERIKEYAICFLLLESFIIGAFCSLDLLLFYIFFEATLIPMIVIIGVWGGEEKIYAAIKFFVYTLVGSLFLLLAIIYIYNQTGSFSFFKLYNLLPKFSDTQQKILFLAMFLAFAVKIPMWPLHTWLPDAHVQAPTAGSVMLAGILIKLGAYGFIRFLLPFFPEACQYFSVPIYALSSIAIIYGSLVAFAQHDMKKMIAYSSVAHMGIVTIGIFARNLEALTGSVIQMISHGLVSAGLFLLIGFIYEQTHTKQISYYGGLAKYTPTFARIFMLFTLAAIGLPGTSGFLGEITVILGVFSVNKIYALFAICGMVLGAVYMLYLYRRIFYGQNNNKYSVVDISKQEVIYLFPLIFLIFLIGFYPKFITGIIEWPILKLIVK